MRKGEIVLITLVSLWVIAGGIAAQKAYWTIEDGECTIQPVLVPVVLDKKCKPNVLLRFCGSASDDIEVDCSWRFEDDNSFIKK